jgi:hypothetical protein
MNFFSPNQLLHLFPATELSHPALHDFMMLVQKALIRLTW